MKKIMTLLVFMCLPLSVLASDVTKVNLAGTNSAKYYKVNFNQERTLVLKGRITAQLISALSDQLKNFNEENTENIFLIINSPGGSVVDGFEFVNVMQSIDSKVYCAIESEAYSMAAIIASFCHKTYIHKNATMMYHEASFGLRGSETEIATLYSFIQRYLDGLAKDVAKQMRIPVKSYKMLAQKNWWLTAEEAAKFGVVDGIINKLYYTAKPPEVKRSFVFSFDKDGSTVPNPLRTE